MCMTFKKYNILINYILKTIQKIFKFKLLSHNCENLENILKLWNLKKLNYVTVFQ